MLILLETFTTGFELNWILRPCRFKIVSMIVLAVFIKSGTCIYWRIVMLEAFRIIRNPRKSWLQYVHLREKIFLPFNIGGFDVRFGSRYFLLIHFLLIYLLIHWNKEKNSKSSLNHCQCLLVSECLIVVSNLSYDDDLKLKKLYTDVCRTVVCDYAILTDWQDT